MERYRIAIFKSFALTSVIMPYFGKTDRIFLVLSSLCTESRKKLNEFYDEFKLYMRKYSTCLVVNMQNIKLLYLPSDLFRFSITLCCKASVIEFIKFVFTLNQKKGFYFGDNYMHQILAIGSIQIEPNHIDILHIHAHILSEVIILSWICKGNNDYKFEERSMIDAFMINLQASNENRNSFTVMNFFTSNNFENIKPAFKPFRKINHAFIRNLKNKECIKNLELIDKASLNIKNLFIAGENSEEFEKLTNPKYFKLTVDNISYSFEKQHEISNKTIKNIKIIKPKSLRLEIFDIEHQDLDSYRLPFDYIRTVCALSHIEDLKIINYLNSSNCIFKFENAYIKVLSRIKRNQIQLTKSKLIKCKQIYLDFAIDKEIKNYWFTSKKTYPDKSEEYFFHLQIFKDFNLFNYKEVTDQSESDEINKRFPQEIIGDKAEFEIIVPLKYLLNVNFARDMYTTINSLKKSADMLKCLKGAKKIICNIDLETEHEYINELASLLPTHTLYTITKRKRFESSDAAQDSDTSLMLFSISNLELLKVNSLSFHSLEQDEFEHISNILSLPNVQNHLVEIDANTLMLSDSLRILELLSQCQHLDEVILSYKMVDLQEEVESIKTAVNQFYKKIGFIKNLTIIKK